MKLDKKCDNVFVLRWVAAVMVIISHAPFVVDGSKDFIYRYTNGQSSLGGISVAVFFFLSGLYVTKSLQKSKSEKEYFFKRCKRIFPQLWLVVALCVFVLGPIVTELSPAAYFTDWHTYLYLLNGLLLPTHELPGVFLKSVDPTVNGPLWTLPVEFAAYMVLLAVWSFSKRVLKKEEAQTFFHILGVAVLFLAMLAVGVILEDPEFMVTVIRPIVLFFVGSLYYDFEEKIPSKPWLGVVCLVLLALSGMTPLFSVAMILFIPYIIVSLVIGVKQVTLKTSFFMTSYEMYLLGMPIQQSVLHAFHYQMAAWQNAAISLLIDLVAAYAVYCLFEKRKHR